MKLKDITRQRGDIISLVNFNDDFKSVRIYKYKDNMIIKSTSHNDLLQISASTPTGPSSKEVILSIFSELTNRNIDQFEINYTGQAIYFFENKIIYN